jgi:5-methylcytosine-specific restriction enzyme A
MSISSFNSKKFYYSKEWRNLREYKLFLDPFCEECIKDNKHLVPAEDVHHIIEVKDDHKKALDIDNLISLCHSCHSKITYGIHTKDVFKKSRTFKLYNHKWNL